MASKGIQCALFLVFAVMTIDEVAAQSGCSTVLVGLAPCLNYVSGNTSTPSSSCCSQLASVVKSQPRCLCTLVNGGGSSLGVNINQTLALSLPKACNVQTPPVSQCNAVDAPAASPTGSSGRPPADSSSGKPADTPPGTSAGSGSKAVPTGTGTSDASTSRMQLYLAVFLISFASCASGIIRV
uniref:Bifunctional inhibitor/plant lipid transfer protein/seed storage helical domain-containing protein n=1 Tax=Rhizophora mucronata TaxID=61149 RepID=A0A2P2P421_RHIMU